MVEQVGKIRIVAYQLRVESLFNVRAKLSAVCIVCRHQGAVDPFALLRWGRYENLTDIEHRLRCLHCRVKGVCKLRVEWES